LILLICCRAGSLLTSRARCFARRSNCCGRERSDTPARLAEVSLAPFLALIFDLVRLLYT
jgi:hypothetical protein